MFNFVIRDKKISSLLSLNDFDLTRELSSMIAKIIGKLRTTDLQVQMFGIVT